ncbi:MAG TPA: PaaI family thioesterase [Gammaproteobacteria bacterium]|nr:PaaI family thioesterase [Gammaproteobacteria bacterium]
MPAPVLGARPGGGERRRGRVLNLSRWGRRLGFLSERRRLELFPPFWLMRVKVLEIAEDGRRMRLRLPLNAASRNMGGAMFGGYQAALADPIPALACARVFPGYSIWTRALRLDFRREGTSDLELRFEFPVELETRVREELSTRGRSTPHFELGFYRDDGVLCTLVHNTVAIRPRGYRAGGG